MTDIPSTCNLHECYDKLDGRVMSCLVLISNLIVMDHSKCSIHITIQIFFFNLRIVIYMFNMF